MARAATGTMMAVMAMTAVMSRTLVADLYAADQPPTRRGFAANAIPAVAAGASVVPFDAAVDIAVGVVTLVFENGRRLLESLRGAALVRVYRMQIQSSEKRNQREILLNCPVHPVYAET